MNELEAKIQIGLDLETSETGAEAIAYFLRLAEEYPDEALVIFETGGAFDYMGREAEAIPYYERASKLGLPEEQQKQLAVQLGSSLRNVGRHAEAVQLLAEACQRFPDYPPLQLFYALALYSKGESKTALLTLFEFALANPDNTAPYQRALRYYVDELSQESATL